MGPHIDANTSKMGFRMQLRGFRVLRGPILKGLAVVCRPRSLNQKRYMESCEQVWHGLGSGF